MNPNPQAPLDGSIPSPLQKEMVDLNKFRDDTTIPAMKEILQIVAQNADVIVFKGQMQKADIDKAFDDVARKVMEVMIRNNVVETNTDGMFQYLQSIFYIIADNLKKQVQGHKREILSRTLGIRNPQSDKFDVDYTNMGDLMAALIKVRKDTGDDMNDFFFVEPTVPLAPNEDTNGQENQS